LSNTRLDRSARLDRLEPFGENIPEVAISSLTMNDIAERAWRAWSPIVRAKRATIPLPAARTVVVNPHKLSSKKCDGGISSREWAERRAGRSRHARNKASE
jgi:hypothetical protein